MEIQGELTPGQNIDFKVSLDNLDLKFSQLDKIEKAEVTITDMNTKESELVTFERKGSILAASVPSVEVKQTFHWDVLILIVLFGLTMFLSQKIMMATQKQPDGNVDPTQQAIQKSMGTFMPIMIIGTFVIIPIPAGVLLYLVTSNIIQIIQTVIVNKQIDMEQERTKNIGNAILTLSMQKKLSQRTRSVTMLLSEYDYNLPEEIIAQMPADKRENSENDGLSRNDRTISHKHF